MNSHPRQSDSAPLSAQCSWPIILGIDPGTSIAGYGALVQADDGPRLLAAGTLRTRGRAEISERLGQLSEQMEELLDHIRPAVVVVEQAFAARNIQSALRIGEARGVVLASAARSGSRVVQYPPATAKKAITGNGRADKTQVAAMVATMLKLDEPPTPLDVTDALGLALAYILKTGSPSLTRAERNPAS